MWFIGVEVEQETSAPPPKKNPGSAPGALKAVLRSNMSYFRPFKVLLLCKSGHCVSSDFVCVTLI